MAPPIHAQERAAHDGLQVLLPVRRPQERHIALVFAARTEGAREALDGHVGEGIQGVEDDAVLAGQSFAVVGFERGLRRGQMGSLRVIDEVEGEPRPSATVTLRVEAPESTQACGEHPLAALGIDIVLEIAG